MFLQPVDLCLSFTTNCVCVWQYLPPVESRSVSGFVGLKNGGATCYMNAVFQQLYMQPGLPEVCFVCCVIFTFCRHQRASSPVSLSQNASGISDYVSFSGILVHRGRHRSAGGERLLPGPVFVRSPDGEQTAVLRTGELLEGNTLWGVVLRFRQGADVFACYAACFFCLYATL